MKKILLLFSIFILFGFASCDNGVIDTKQNNADPHPNMSHLENQRFATPENPVASPSGEYIMVIEPGFHDNVYDNKFVIYKLDDQDNPLFHSDVQYRT